MEPELNTTVPPSPVTSHPREHIVVATGVALLAAGLALVVGVLPAEFGADPTGLGARLGLVALADVKRQVDVFQSAQAGASGAQRVTAAARPFSQDTVSFTLEPGGFIEYKYRLEQGQSLLYSWSATGAVASEFHAEPDGAPRGYAETYEKRPPSEHAAGTLVAPFTGIHGWYWENATGAPVTVTLSSAGFYTLAHEFRKDTPPTVRTFR